MRNGIGQQLFQFSSFRC